MVGGILLSLLNPLISIIFAVTFFCMWSYRKDQRYVALLSISYLLVAAGFIFNQFRPTASVAVISLTTTVLFTIGAVMLTVAVLTRYRNPVPWTALILLAAIAVFGDIWFLLVQPNLNGRIYSVNFAYGGMLLLAAAKVLAVREKTRLDTVFCWILFAGGAQFFVRTIAVLAIDAPTGRPDDYISAAYWVTLNFTIALFSLLTALTLISMVVLDMMEDLRRDSLIDALSALWNRRGFEERALIVMDRARRIGVPATLVVGDLDHFKAINDRFGHLCGDGVIVAFSRCLKDAAGADDVTARMGGEEFAVFLTAADLLAGRLFAEATRNACLALAVDGLPASHLITASFGVAQARPGESLAALMRRADTALYEAKRHGRDRVCLADDPVSPIYLDGSPGGGAPQSRASG